jgi:hypothetical protein
VWGGDEAVLHDDDVDNRSAPKYSDVNCTSGKWGSVEVRGREIAVLERDEVRGGC